MTNEDQVKQNLNVETNISVSKKKTLSYANKKSVKSKLPEVIAVV
jgi:hypothetical protein